MAQSLNRCWVNIILEFNDLLNKNLLQNLKLKLFYHQNLREGWTFISMYAQIYEVFIYLLIKQKKSS